MATDGTNQTEGTRTLPDMKEVLEALPDGQVLGDMAHRIMYRRALLLERAREASLRRDAMRLAAKHGKDAPRARAESARAQAQTREVQVYRDEVRKAGVATPPVGEGTALYGRVLDNEGVGMARHEVRVEGLKGMGGATKTDRCGRFRLVFGDEVGEKVTEDPTERDQPGPEGDLAEAEAATAEKERAEKEKLDGQADPSMKKGPAGQDAGLWSQVTERMTERLADLNRTRSGVGLASAVRVTVLDPDGNKVAGARETLVGGQALYREYTVRSKPPSDC